MKKDFCFKKAISLGLSAVLICVGFSACGKQNTEYSEYSYYEYVSGDSTTSSDASNGSTASGSTEPAKITEVPTNLKGTTVKLLWWQQFTDAEKKVIKSFEDQTGIKVEYKSASNAAAPYTELISASLAAKEGYDVVMFGNTDFPGRPTDLMQPLDGISTFNASDSAWDISMMDSSKINGKYYGVNIKSSLETEYVVMYYNKTMFNDRGVKTPREYWKGGNWNWDTFLECAKAMTYESNGKKIYGYVNLTSANLNYWSMSAGSDFVTYSDNSFKSNLSDPILIKSVKFYSDLYNKYGYMNEPSTYGVTAFRAGEAAMLSCISYAMRKDSSTKFNQMTDTIDAVPFPSPSGSESKALTITKLFGVLQGAKNPDGAVYFLRYFLDPSNYDMPSYFINSNLKSTFDEMSKLNKVGSVAEGVVNYAAMTDYGSICHNIALTSSDQIEAKLQSYASVIETSLKKANRAIS